MFFKEEYDIVLGTRNKKVRSKLEAAFKLRREAKDLGEFAKHAKEVANAALAEALEASNMDKVESMECEVAQFKTKKTTTLDKDGAQKYLIGKGVSPVVARNAFSKNTVVKESAKYIDFRVPKGGK